MLTLVNAFKRMRRAHAKVPKSFWNRFNPLITPLPFWKAGKLLPSTKVNYEVFCMKWGFEQSAKLSEFRNWFRAHRKMLPRSTEILKQEMIPGELQLVGS